jgi:hypothetical protein
VRKGWEVTRVGPSGPRGFIHVVPVDDLRPHKLLPRCWCGPTLERQINGTLVTHNAEDGRELVERHGVN